MAISANLSSPLMILVVSLIFVFGTLSFNLLVPVLPVSGPIFVFISLTVWFIALCFTFVGLHKLLQRKEPIPNAVLNKFLRYCTTAPKDMAIEKKTTIRASANSIKRLTEDIDKYFITRWYCNISNDLNFPVESKAFLEDVITRVAEVALQMNSNSVLHGVLNIFLKHLKEFRRGLKRTEKYNVAIEEAYRYSHICSLPNNKSTRDYFIHQLTIGLLHPFINSELWNSLPCHVLISILARKLMFYLLNLLSSPQVLNYMILNALASKEVKEKLQLEQYGQISIVEFFDVIDDISDAKKEPAMENSTVQPPEGDIFKKAKELQRKVEEATSKRKEKNIGQVEVDTSRPLVVLRQRGLHSVVDGQTPIDRSPSKRSDPVKIYEPRSSAKTWRDSRDLACVSLGQDPLDMLMVPSDSGCKTANKQSFWEPSTKTGDSKHDSPPTASHLFNEVMQMTSMEGLKTSIKPLSDVTERTLHNIKDLQEATVHNALHKIGDFQVTDKQPIDPLNYLHYLPPNTLLHSSVLSNTQRLHAHPEDEAAGMVEGILDFGRAGFRKGLRLTGLHDNIENAKTASTNSTSVAKSVVKPIREQVKKKLDDFKRLDSEAQERVRSADIVDSVWINPLQIDSPNYDGHILLERSSKPDFDSNQPPRIENLPIPSISTEEVSGTDSPDPEYEDTADLASSIAKLRSLLQQRSSESSLSTPALSPMPDEYSKQAESENLSDVEALEVDGVMPSFYKFCTKTASGVFSNTFNSIKTALPGNSSESLYTVELWKFLTDQKETDTLIRMKKLLSERKEYCILDKEIEAAYDALDSVDIFQPKLMPNLQFEDELEDFEGKLPITKVLLDIACELLVETNSFLIQEPIIKIVLLLFGAALEQKVTSLLNKFLEYLAQNLVTIPESTNSRVLSMDIEDYVDSIEKSTPDTLKYLLGKDNFKSALKLLISSLQKPRINQDVLLQGFELIVMRLIEESSRISPPASA